MHDPRTENKNTDPMNPPWSIKTFPIDLRRRVAADAAKEGITIPGKLEDIVKAHYAKK